MSLVTYYLYSKYSIWACVPNSHNFSYIYFIFISIVGYKIHSALSSLSFVQRSIMLLTERCKTVVS